MRFSVCELRCKKILVATLALLISTFAVKGREKDDFIQENVTFSAAQTEKMLQALGTPTGKNYPRTMRGDQSLAVTGMYEWTSGFFPGTLWYLYELTGDAKWKNEAERWTASLATLQTFTGSHDLGFMVNCSYGNAERLAFRPEYRDVLLQSAASLATRFNPKNGVIKSWNRFVPWNDTLSFSYPVIIDNMMNLELLLYASKISGEEKYRDIAVKHADATLKNHFRENFSTAHVVLYDAESPTVIAKHTAQGLSDNSTWARGQAWAIYGFTMVYRETKDPKYLDAARKAADYYLANLPEDKIPWWDFNAGQAGYTPGKRSHATQFQGKPKDASAGAIVCSALFELGELSGNGAYIQAAVEILHRLASPAYRAELGANANFLLMHSVGSIPHATEIDKPLVYADYYFLEVLIRYRKLKSTETE